MASVAGALFCKDVRIDLLLNSMTFIKIGDKLYLATLLGLTTAAISGTNNFLTKIAVTAIKDPVLFTTLKNALVAAFLIGAILMLKKLP